MRAVPGARGVSARPVTVALVAFLAIQSFVGGDVTDEIQYSYQMLGLVATDRLFRNDLYVQQLVYLPFWPLLKLYHLVFGEHGLILFGRLIFALILFGLYSYARNRLHRSGVEPVAAALAALALCYAPAYHGLFAISYNTISQIGWVLATLFVVLRVPASAWLWAATITATGLAHPPSGVAIALICAREQLVRREPVRLLRIVLISLMFSGALGGLILWLSGGVEELRRALVFSAGFSVGSALLSGTILKDLLVIAALFLAACLAPPARRFADALIVLLVTVIVLGATHLLTESLERRDEWVWVYSYSRAIVEDWAKLCAIALYTFRCVQARRVDVQSTAYLLAIMCLIQAVVLTGTSSNGIGQAIGAFSILMPVVAALIARSANETDRATWLFRAPALGAAVLGIVLSVGLPYRQAPLYAFSRGYSDLPLFKGLLLAIPVLEFAESARRQIGPHIPAEKGAVISSYPGLYPILGITPQTCMIYNHSLGSEAAEMVFKECLIRKGPRFIAQVHATSPEANSSRMSAFVGGVAAALGLGCRTHSFSLNAAPPSFPDPPALTLCK